MSSRVKYLRVVGAVLVVSLVGAGCQSGSVVEEGFSGYAKSLARTAPPFQAAILEDGEVTFAEYERAMQASRQCLIDKGWEVSKIEEDPINGWSIGYSIGWKYDGDDARDERLLAQLDIDFSECGSEYHTTVERAYEKSRIPSEEERPEMMNSLLACLEAEGVTGIPADADIYQFWDAIDEQTTRDVDDWVAFQCVERYHHLFLTLNN